MLFMHIIHYIVPPLIIGLSHFDKNDKLYIHSHKGNKILL
jgi:hypothetical protein